MNCVPSIVARDGSARTLLIRFSVVGGGAFSLRFPGSLSETGARNFGTAAAIPCHSDNSNEVDVILEASTVGCMEFNAVLGFIAGTFLVGRAST